MALQRAAVDEARQGWSVDAEVNLEQLPFSNRPALTAPWGRTVSRRAWN